jgi:hypothetical protein
MQKEWLPFVVFLGGIFSLVALLKLWGHRCPKCKTRMKRVSQECLGLQPPQIINWVDACGIPPDDITVFRCPKCGYKHEQREPVRDSRDE